jgi:hypothetical protein
MTSDQAYHQACANRLSSMALAMSAAEQCGRIAWVAIGGASRGSALVQSVDLSSRNADHRPIGLGGIDNVRLARAHRLSSPNARGPAQFHPQAGVPTDPATGFDSTDLPVNSGRAGAEVWHQNLIAALGAKEAAIGRVAASFRRIRRQKMRIIMHFQRDTRTNTAFAPGLPCASKLIVNTMSGSQYVVHRRRVYKKCHLRLLFDVFTR